MSKKKIFLNTGLSDPSTASAVPGPMHHLETGNHSTAVAFAIDGRRGSKRFDFKALYGIGVDAVTTACQRQIERLLNKQDVELESATIAHYCFALNGFLQYLALRSTAVRRELSLKDIDRNVIDGYLMFMDDGGISTVTQKNYYNATKAVLKLLCTRGLITETVGGDDATFPRNPFPGAARKSEGERPLPKAQRQAFSAAVKSELMPLFGDDVEPTSYLLACALLVIALHTGRNTSPLLEMTVDCLRSHPKDDTLFLVVHKRRGHSTSKVALSAQRADEIESMPTVWPTVARLVRRVIILSQRLRDEAPAHLRDRIWLHRKQKTASVTGGKPPITALCQNSLNHWAKALVSKHNLTDTDGTPMRINVSRLRKTFVNRMYEILDGDVVGTAAAAGNSVHVVQINYLRPGEDAMKNWQFMGATLTEELLTHTVGTTQRTPMGACTDNKTGDFAPKRDGALCMSFLNCLRCRNYVVTGDDLYRLFSFYWRVLDERARMDPKRWRRQFAHIVRLIDRDVVDAGVANKMFRAAAVNRERDRAKHDPHPFWKSDTIMADLAGGGL